MTDDFERATLTFDDGRTVRVLVEIFRVEPRSNISENRVTTATSVELYGLAISADSAFEGWVAESPKYSRMFDAAHEPALAAQVEATDARFAELAPPLERTDGADKPIDTQDNVSTRANPIVVQISAKELEDHFADHGGIEIDAESLNFYRIDDVTEIDSIDPDPPEMYDDEFIALKMSGDLYMGLRHRAVRMGLTMRGLLWNVADKSNRAPNSRLVEP